jgi:hypothetical protein
MKKIYFFLLSSVLFTQMHAQEFATRLSEAKSAYSAGKLDDARFAMQQMLQEIDIITGKEVLKLLPSTMEDKAANTKADNVAGSSSFFGVIIHREYGTATTGNINMEIVSNSPLIGSLNAILSIPFMGSSGDQKIVKVNGYKALVQKTTDADNRTDYELQLPLNNSLITLKAPGYTQEQVIKMANALPVADIAKMLQ